MVTYKPHDGGGRCGPLSILGTGLIGAAMACSIVAYAHRPKGDDIRPGIHKCDDPACRLCEPNRRFEREHPGRRADEMAAAAEDGQDVRVLNPIEHPWAFPPTEALPVPTSAP